MSNIPAHLLTPRDWQAEAVAHAARECGTPEGRRALAEATRYGALADRLADLQAALDAEHAQRLSLQHHAADQAQRVADLEAEIERITEAGRAHIRRAAALEYERDRSAQLFGELSCEYDALQDECDSLRAETERLARQLREARAEGGAAASERAEPAADLEALVAELLACLRDCVEYVDEEELKHVAAYGEHHHAARLARVREDAKKARAAIARAEGGAA